MPSPSFCFSQKFPACFPRISTEGILAHRGEKMEKIGKKLDFWRQGWYNKAINIVFGAVFRFFPVSRSCSFFCSFFFTAAAVSFSTAHRRLKAVVFSLREGYNSFRTRGPSPMRGGAAPHPLRSSPCMGAPPLHPGGLCGTVVPAPIRRALRPSTPAYFLA